MKVQAAVAGCHTKCRLQQWAGALSAAESYPTSEVRDTGAECPAVTVQERPGGVTPRPRSVAARRRHPASEVRGGDLEEPRTPEARAGGEEEQPRSGGCTGAGGPRGAISR